MQNHDVVDRVAIPRGLPCALKSLGKIACVGKTEPKRGQWVTGCVGKSPDAMLAARGGANG